MDLHERDAEDIREFSLSLRRESMLNILYHFFFHPELFVCPSCYQKTGLQTVSEYQASSFHASFLRAVGCLWPPFSVPVMYFTQYHVVTTCDISLVHRIVEQLSTSRRRCHYRLAVTRVSLRPSNTFRLASGAAETCWPVNVLAWLPIVALYIWCSPDRPQLIHSCLTDVRNKLAGTRDGHTIHSFICSFDAGNLILTHGGLQWIGKGQMLSRPVMPLLRQHLLL